MGALEQARLEEAFRKLDLLALDIAKQLHCTILILFQTRQLLAEHSSGRPI
jgi:hypothetical protein